ncbi:MAG: prepilin-type N-terminal cleavage/methylation domain-containing protein [Sulfurospirillum sp.]
MRVKAFTLIELLVVILLLGIIFSLALGTFSSKKSIFKSPNIDNLPQYIKKIEFQGSSIFYIYGDKCDKNTILHLEKIYSDSTVAPFSNTYKIYSEDKAGFLKIIDYPPAILNKKRQHICFKLNLYAGKFIDKLIVDTGTKFLLFYPFYQKVISFNTLKEARKAYFKDDMFPRSIDDYYHK